MTGLPETSSPCGEKITITGIIIPVEWDEKGNPVSTAVSTYSEREYLIDPSNRKGLELQKLFRQKVRLTGTLGFSKSGRQIITVKKYTKLHHGAPSDLENGKEAASIR